MGRGKKWEGSNASLPEGGGRKRGGRVGPNLHLFPYGGGGRLHEGKNQVKEA